jgi:hypothetical protein
MAYTFPASLNLSGFDTASSFLPITKPAGTMDPGTATLIGGGISALGSGASAIGGKNAGNQARAAAREQAEAVQKAGREVPLVDFYLDTAGEKFNAFIGDPAKRFNSIQDIALQGALVTDPGSSGLIEAKRNALRKNADLYGKVTPGFGAAYSRFFV